MKQEELIQTNINEEKLYESELKSEQRINSSDKEININDYSEIIPQKIEKEKYYISTENDDILKQNLEFSFGKNSKKNEELNRLNTDYLDKKEILSDNLSNYQLTDSLTNLIEKEDDNKKLKLIKEKFISNFKSKVRSESLEKAFTLFEKFHNYRGNNNYNKMNMSCSQKYVKPFQFLASQNTNSLTIIDNKNNKRQKGNNEKIIEQNKTLNLAKSNDDFFKYKKRKILRIIKENEKENKENNEIRKFSDDVHSIQEKEELLSSKKEFLITFGCYCYVVAMAIGFDKIIILDSFNGSTVANYINIIAPCMFYLYFAKDKKNNCGDKTVASFNVIFGTWLIIFYFILLFF